MGSPLAPLLANWFVAKVENNILQQPLPCAPVLYKRYVDDIFALFRTTDDRDQFYEVLNNAHPNLSFTMEVSTTSLPFLDTSVSIRNRQFVTQVYRKPTNTGVVMNYRCMAPSRWKRSLIKCFLRRAYTISSSYAIFMTEVERIKANLIENAYPEEVVVKNVKEFVQLHGIDELHFKTAPPATPQKTAEKSSDYILIPYVGKPSLRFQSNLKRTFEEMGLAVKAAYSTTKVSEYFSLKSSASVLYKSNVVYKFTCFCDRSISYIGESRRQLFARINEHCGDNNNSAVFDHIRTCTPCQNSKKEDRFEVLHNCTRYNLLSAEAMLIAKHKPILNTQLGPNEGAVVSLSLYR